MAGRGVAEIRDRVKARVIGRERERDERLARLGWGRLRHIRTYRDVAPALSDLFS
jgi:hypothetical protein